MWLVGVDCIMWGLVDFVVSLFGGNCYVLVSCLVWFGVVVVDVIKFVVGV